MRPTHSRHYPVAANAAEIAETIQPEISLVKDYDHDYTMHHTFLLFIDKYGNAAEAEFIGGSNRHFAESLKEKIIFTKLSPAKRKQDNVASDTMATVSRMSVKF